MELCRELGALYIDTVVEPWLGFYFDKSKGPGRAHQLRAARDGARGAKRKNPGGTTAVSCCGANPGMVSWFVKQALLNSPRSRSRGPSRTDDREAGRG
jgi:homospermidine synthase